MTEEERHNEQTTSLINEIETIEKNIASLSQQVTAINSSISQKQLSLGQLKNHLTELEKYRETLGFFKRKERKMLDKEKLPELNRKIEEQNTEIKELSGKVYALTRQEREAKNRVQQIREEKDKLQQEEDERLRKEAEEAEKVEKHRLAEEKRKKEEALINSASQGDAKAQYDLSVWYFNEKNIEQYIHWLKQAAECGYPTAQRQLGLVYLEGKNSITKDINKAVEWLEKAAEQGYLDCQFRLGYLYRYGDTGFKADINKGLYWLEKAANNNNADAQYQLATLYGDDSQNVLPVDLRKMVLWLEKAVKQGHKQAAFHLARLHADKIIPNADFNIAFRLLNQVVNDSQNPSVPLAMIYLGALYCAGKGTERNPEQGADYIEKGMERNKENLDPNFCFRLGKLHYDARVYGKTESGKYYRKELKQALILFKMASAGGITDATEYIVKTLKSLKELFEGDITICKEMINDSITYMNNYETFWSDDVIANHKKRCRDRIESTNESLEKTKQELNTVTKELQAIEDKAYDW